MRPLPALTLAIAALPGAVGAEALSCQVVTDCGGEPGCAEEVLYIAFAIDRRQFAPSVGVGDPPRVKRTRVTAGDAIFAAEPIVIGSTRGFWEDAEALGARMLTVTGEGAATYTDTGTGRTMRGRCEETG